MSKRLFLVGLILFFSFGMITEINAQCSICTKTAQQMGEKPAKGLNAGILYLAALPFLLGGYIFYRWKKSDKGF
jgi:hypothetical protein